MISARAARSSAFILTLVLSLLTSVALAQKTDPADKYADSEYGIVSSGVIKSLTKDCPAGTDAFFKNANPFISGGSGGEPGVFTSDVTFLIDGTEVTLSVTWRDNNSFEFGPPPDSSEQDPKALVLAVGAEIDSDKLIYTYPVPVFEDSGLNVLDVDPPVASADVNHLDLCLALADTTGPAIEFISPLSGDTVAGTVTVIVKVTDDSGVNVNTDPDPVNPVTVSIIEQATQATQTFNMECVPEDPSSQNAYECSYTWDTGNFPTGPYTIAVSATDKAIPEFNTRTVSVNVELIDYVSCFGTEGDEDFAVDPTEFDPDGNVLYAGGCNPTGAVLIQAPPDNSACNGPTPPAGCYIDGTLLKPANPTAHCGDYGFPDPRMTMIEGPSDLYPVGRWVPTSKRPLDIFTEIGIDPAQESGVLAAVRASYPDCDNDPDCPTDLVGALVLDDKTYCANGCCAIAQHFKGNLLDELYIAWPNINGLAFIKIHNAKTVLGDDLAASCYDETTNPDLQDAAAVGYYPLFQTEDDRGFLTVLTQRCQNPLSDFTRNNGFDVSNIIVSTAEPRIFVDDAPTDVLDFMYQQSQDDFDRIFVLLGIIEDDNLLLSGNFERDVASPINQAKQRFSNFNLVSLKQSIGALNEGADGFRTKTTYVVIEANPPGEALALVEHLIGELGLLYTELARVEALP